MIKKSRRTWFSGHEKDSNKNMIMNEMILFGGKMIRINPKDAKRLEYSNSQGKSWQTLFSGGSPGEFKGLMDGGSELLAQTSKGLFYSKNDGKSWQKRS